METHDQYHVNLFKPSTPYSQANSKLIISVVLIWAIAVLGFQVLLKVVEKPTPEKSFLDFQRVRPSLQMGTASVEDFDTFKKSLVLVLGKTLQKEHRALLMSAVNAPSGENLPYDQLEAAMKTYTVHNQSFLTDFRFLGFPFHYWYTAEFLLILFVFLCWFYCKRIVQLQKKHNVKDEA